jgi:hypothetical protein
MQYKKVAGHGVAGMKIWNKFSASVEAAADEAKARGKNLLSSLSCWQNERTISFPRQPALSKWSFSSHPRNKSKHGVPFKLVRGALTMLKEEN